jgi:hypothetical protein
MPTSLAQKLQLKAGQCLRVLNATQSYVDRLAQELPDIIVNVDGSGSTEAVLLFVSSLAEAERLAPTAIGQIDVNGLLWIAYPKGGSKIKTDVNRDRLWEAIKPTGWRPVRQVALDEVWSAMRFRPAGRVGI